MEYAAIIAAAVSAIAALVGMGKEDEAQAIRDKMAREYGLLVVPKLDAILFEKIGPTALRNISMPAEGRNAQLAALRGLEESYQQGGMTDADRAAMRLAENSVAAQSIRGAQQAAQLAAQRGAGAGMQAALHASYGQEAAGALANMGAQSQIAARQRALSALEGMGSLGGSIRQQDYAQASEAARAQDAINQFNARMAMEATQSENARRMAVHNAGMERQDAISNARAGYAAGLDRSAQSIRNFGSGVGQGVLTVGSYLDQGQRDSNRGDTDWENWRKRTYNA